MEVKPFIYQFDDVRVDLEKFEVRKADTRARLEPKAVEALVFLIENRGRLVEKKEMLDAVWKDAFVTENAMTRVIAQLRKALGDDSKEAKYIETVPTRGYRFIAEVKERVEPDDEKAIQPENASGDRELSQGKSSVDEQMANASVTPLVQPDTKSRGRVASRRAQVLVVCTMIVGLAVALSYLWILLQPKPSSDGAAIRSIAVLPFKPLVAASHNEYLEMGIADALISKLGSIREIVVRPIGAVRKYTDPEQDAVAIGKTLGVDAVLDSSIQMVGDKTRVRTQLVRVTDGKQIWRFECDDQCAGIFDVQDSISEQIISALTLTLTAEETTALKKRYTNDPETYRLYMMGHYHLDKRTVADAERARDYFQQAVDRDANYALAYAGMSDAYSALYLLDGLPAQGAMPKAKEAALTGLKIDDRLSELHAALGDVEKHYDWDWAGAEREFRRALELDPRSVRAHHLYAHYLKDMGRFDESISEIKAALHEEPTSVFLNRVVAQILYYARRYDEAIAQCNKTLEMDPHFGTVYGWLGLSYEQKGLRDLAVETFLKRRAVEGSAQDVSASEAAYKKAGWRGYWELELERLQTAKKRYGWVNDNAIAQVYVRLGRTDLAIESLERAFRERTIQIDLKVEPRFDSIRSDPRFKRLLSLMNFPP
jgi:DNA-binding winged helix-turn-helix (wHTH) protein/TolB-like protein/tetratricopeptide (TPR) repeat protein